MRKTALALLAACGVFQVGKGLWFIVVRPPMLPEDEALTGARLDALTRTAPGLPLWLDRVFTVLGGHILATGLLALLAVYLLRNRTIDRAALILLGAAGAMSVVLMSGVNFAIHSDYRWLLLLPALVWIIAVLLLARSALSRTEAPVHTAPET